MLQGAGEIYHIATGMNGHVKKQASRGKWLIRATVGIEKLRTVFTQGKSQGCSMLANQSENEVEGKVLCSFVLLLWNELFPAIPMSITRL